MFLPLVFTCPPVQLRLTTEWVSGFKRILPRTATEWPLPTVDLLGATFSPGCAPLATFEYHDCTVIASKTRLATADHTTLFEYSVCKTAYSDQPFHPSRSTSGELHFDPQVVGCGLEPLDPA